MKMSFRDPATGVLMAWGYAAANGGDLTRDESDDFSLEPGKWQLVDEVWVPYNATPVPQVVTMRQAQTALLNAGLLDAVDAAIAAIEDPAERRQALIDWEKSQAVQRNWPLVARLAPALGLTEEQTDQLFITAATL